MNFKKFISGVSALAIAASAFAGMAVTASAADLSADLAVSGYEAKAFYNFKTNSPDVLPTTGSNDAMIYRANYGLYNFGSGSRSAEVNIPVQAGDILVMDLYTTSTDKNKNPIDVSTITLSIDKGTLNTTLTESTGYRVFDITSDAEKINVTSTRYGVIRSALVMNVKEGATFTVSAKASTGQTLVDDTVVDAGSEFKYSYPKFLTDANHKVVATTSETAFSKTVTPTTDQVYTVNYSEYNGTAYFYEAEDFGGYKKFEKNVFSSGKATRSLTDNNTKITLNIPADGVYKITMAVASEAAKVANMSLYKNSTDTAALVTGSSQWAYNNPVLYTTENVALTSADKLIAYGSDSNSGLDYILLEKTGEYPYAITKADTTNGSFDVSATTATAGTTVTVTATPAEGYELGTITVNGTAIEGTSFTMPAEDVTVAVIFNKTQVTPAEPTVTPTEIAVDDNVDNDGVTARAWKAEIASNGTAINNIKVSVEGSKEGSQIITLGNTDANVVIGVIIASADADKVLSAAAPIFEVNVE